MYFWEKWNCIEYSTWRYNVVENKENFYIMSELQVKIQTTAFIRHPPLLFVSSQNAQAPLLFGTFSTAFIWHSGVISEVPKGWHYDFQDGETVFNFQGPRGVTTVYGNMCPNKGESKIYVLGDRVF